MVDQHRSEESPVTPTTSGSHEIDPDSLLGRLAIDSGSNIEDIVHILYFESSDKAT